jgi:hypothetical protein
MTVEKILEGVFGVPILSRSGTKSLLGQA